MSQRQFLPDAHLKSITRAQRVDLALCRTVRGAHGISERFGVEPPILLECRCAGADFRAPEIEPRATARPGMAHQRVIHRIIGAQAACLKSAASPIWIDRKSTRLNSSH